MTTGYSFYPHSILSAFSLVTIHENDGILDEERRTWTRSVGTKNRSSRRTGTRSGTKNRLSSANGEPFNGQPGSLVLSYHEPLPPTPFSCFFLQLASWNLQLSFYKRLANSKNEEQVLALERRTDYPRRTVNRSTVNQVLSFFPTRTRNPQPRSYAFSYNLHLGTCN